MSEPNPVGSPESGSESSGDPDAGREPTGPVDAGGPSVAVGAGDTRGAAPLGGATHVEGDPCRAPEPPTYVFFASIAAVVLFADVVTKAWAEVRFDGRPRTGRSIVLLEDQLQLVLTYNRGGAWGLLQNLSEWIRRPFFVAVSLLAIGFLVFLYGRLQPNQKALKWGLPFVLGGALGNLSDRITRPGVVDFIDFRADWIATMNRGVAMFVEGWSVTDHWPTFNVADIAICIGVALMAVDMLVAQRSESGIPVTVRRVESEGSAEGPS